MPNFPETRISLILRLAQPSDLEAWREFAEIYGPAIYLYARKKGLQAADAEDLAQETLFAVAKGIERFEPDPTRARFRTWLVRIARNRIADFCEGRSRRPGLHSMSDSWLSAQSQLRLEAARDLDDEFTPEYRTSVFHLAAKRVQTRVSASTWQAFHATTIAMEPAEEVAQRLGISLGNLYVSRCRVLKLLREEVQGIEAKFSDPSAAAQFDETSIARQGGSP